MTAAKAEFQVLHQFDAGWAEKSHGAGLKRIQRAAEETHSQWLSGPRAISVRTLPLTTLPYPTKYAFWGAATSPAPYVTMTHRCLLVQFHQNGQLKNLLFNPTDVDAARRTPFFLGIHEKYGAFEKMLVTRYGALEEQLAQLGVRTGDIDYIAFDHFHTQDLRALLGTTNGSHSARFPNATLLAPKAEWIDWDDLHPLQAAWFVADGREHLKMDHVQLIEQDLCLGDGVYLLRTPGHTSGNQTLFVHTDSGIWGVSENGTCVDNWTPIESKISGLRSYAKGLGLDVILNANTPEGAANQYTSMMLERALVSRVKRAPAFVQMFSSSEVTPGLLAPALSPSLLFKEITHGTVSLSR